MTEPLRIGDRVIWRGGWGSDPPAYARVKQIERTEGRRDKYGESVAEVAWGETFVVTLDNGHWAYSDQLAPAPGDDPLARARQQVALLRRAGWQIDVFGEDEGGLYVTGRDNHGDGFRGRIVPAGHLVGEPADD